MQNPLAERRDSTMESLPRQTPASTSSPQNSVILWTFSYFSFRSNVARNCGENSWSVGQTRSRKGPELVRAVRKLDHTCTSCYGQVWYRYISVQAHEAGVRRGGCRDAASKRAPREDRRVRPT